jgi:hypothetical protein
MGGSSKDQQTQQQSQTAPWAPAQPLLGGILGKLSGSLQNGDLTGAEWDALSRCRATPRAAIRMPAASAISPNDLLNGGGPDRTGLVNDAYAQYQKMLQPFARGDYVDPSSNPTLQKYLQTIQDGVSNQVNGMFAGAGRDLSGANQQTLSRGIAQGEAPCCTTPITRASRASAAPSIHCTALAGRRRGCSPASIRPGSATAARVSA